MKYEPSENKNGLLCLSLPENILYFHISIVHKIDNFDKALALTFKMPEIDRKIVWAVAHSAAFRDRGAKWTQIARLLSLNDPRIVKRKYQDALIELFYKHPYRHK